MRQNHFSGRSSSLTLSGIFLHFLHESHMTHLKAIDRPLPKDGPEDDGPERAPALVALGAAAAVAAPEPGALEAPEEPAPAGPEVVALSEELEEEESAVAGPDSVEDLPPTPPLPLPAALPAPLTLLPVTTVALAARDWLACLGVGVFAVLVGSSSGTSQRFRFWSHLFISQYHSSGSASTSTSSGRRRHLLHRLQATHFSSCSGTAEVVDTASPGVRGWGLPVLTPLGLVGGGPSAPAAATVGPAAAASAASSSLLPAPLAEPPPASRFMILALATLAAALLGRSEAGAAAPWLPPLEARGVVEPTRSAARVSGGSPSSSFTATPLCSAASTLPVIGASSPRGRLRGWESAPRGSSLPPLSSAAFALSISSSVPSSSRSKSSRSRFFPPAPPALRGSGVGTSEGGSPSSTSIPSFAAAGAAAAESSDGSSLRSSEAEAPLLLASVLLLPVRRGLPRSTFFVSPPLGLLRSRGSVTVRPRRLDSFWKRRAASSAVSNTPRSRPLPWTMITARNLPLAAGSTPSFSGGLVPEESSDDFLALSFFFGPSLDGFGDRGGSSRALLDSWPGLSADAEEDEGFGVPPERFSSTAALLVSFFVGDLSPGFEDLVASAAFFLSPASTLESRAPLDCAEAPLDPPLSPVATWAQRSGKLSWRLCLTASSSKRMAASRSVGNVPKSTTVPWMDMRACHLP
mmetsp:Transcript_22638/g.65845  ORF Transcript_22638/g.65845 Transcript_22638/m.65845 type:complete len:691 (-) Transcript_22638:266-2338(-)